MLHLEMDELVRGFFSTTSEMSSFISTFGPDRVIVELASAGGGGGGGRCSIKPLPNRVA